MHRKKKKEKRKIDGIRHGGLYNDVEMLTDPRCKGVCKNGERCSMEGGNPMILTN